MGYEITFKYHEKKEQGGYDTEDQKEFSKLVGKGAEDVPLEKLAKIVLSQLARRDIWVVDVIIYEISKKRISFSETKGGVVIKHKKFMLDGSSISSEELIEPNAVTTLEQPVNQVTALVPAVVQQLPAQVKKMSGVTGILAYQNQQPLRYEIFDPQVAGMIEAARRRGYKFTLGKRYPIYDEKPVPGKAVGMLYYTVDDEGNKQILNDLHFSPELKPLEQGFDAGNEKLYIDRVRENKANLGSGSGMVDESQFIHSLPEIVNPLARR